MIEQPNRDQANYRYYCDNDRGLNGTRARGDIDRTRWRLLRDPPYAPIRYIPQQERPLYQGWRGRREWLDVDNMM